MHQQRKRRSFPWAWMSIVQASQASATSRHSRLWVSSLVSFDPFPCFPYLVPLVWIFGWRAGLFGFRYPVAAVLFPVPCPLVLGATFPCTCLCVPTPATFLFVSAAFGFVFVSSTFEAVCPCFDRFVSVPVDVRREVRFVRQRLCFRRHESSTARHGSSVSFLLGNRSRTSFLCVFLPRFVHTSSNGSVGSRRRRRRRRFFFFFAAWDASWCRSSRCGGVGSSRVLRSAPTSDRSFRSSSHADTSVSFFFSSLYFPRSSCLVRFVSFGLSRITYDRAAGGWLG